MIGRGLDRRVGISRWAAVTCCGLLLIAFPFGSRCMAGAAEQGDAATEPGFGEEPQAPQGVERYWQEIQDSFQVLAKLQLSGALAEPTDSTQNPGNDFARIPARRAQLELRPDVSFASGKFEVLVKPRWNIQWQQWHEGEQAGDADTETDGYVNEWEVRFLPNRQVLLGYGRLNLQWGPSYFLSPSNPFFRDNGQSNPRQEVGGMGFARLLWFLNSDWTLSLLANLDEGRQEFILDSFERTYAVKLDYVGFRRYGSLIGSYREEGLLRLGGYGSRSVSDGLTFYLEGNITLGSDVLYPTTVVETPLGPILLMEDRDSDDWSPQETFLLGTSYTFELGPTLNLEYVYNSPGYSDEDAEKYYDFRKVASLAFGAPFPLIQDIGRFFLAQTLDPHLRLLRRNYLAVQYQQAQIRDVFSLLIRCVYNLDDRSAQLIPVLQYDLGDHVQLFANGLHTFGAERSEFRSLLHYGWMFGLEYTY